MSIHLEVVLTFLAIGLLHQTSSSPPKEISLLESVDHLMSSRPSHLSWIPSIAYETMPKDEYQQRQFIKDRKYERQVELILADLQAHLTAKTGAHEFFKRATVYGLPGSDNLKFYESFILSYDNRLKQPAWVLEHLTKSQFIKTRVRRPRKKPFYKDMTLHEYFRTGHSDYKKSMYDRGQFASACNNRIKHQLLLRSYLYSNTAPMTTNLDRDRCAWVRLEKYIAFLAWRTQNVYVVTGSLYKPYKLKRQLRYRLIGRNRVAVPTHFYKVILYEDHDGHLSIEAFVAQNSILIKTDEELDRFRINADDLDKLEGWTGLQFFNLLDKCTFRKPKVLQYGFLQFGEE